MSHYASASKSYDDGDYAGDEDDMEEDDSYDCLSDYDGDMDAGAAVSGEGPSNGGDKRSDIYVSRSSHHHGGKANAASSGRHRTEFRRYRNAGDRPIPDHSDENRRDHHNHLERKRRASIKGSYCDLREAIPSLRGSKASRAVTLQRAAEYIATLTKSNREHSFCVDELTRQNEVLERQVQDLYRNYQRLENDEYALTQAGNVTQSGNTLSQAGSSVSFNTPLPPSTLPITSTSPSTSTANSTPTASTLALTCGGGSGGSNSCNSSTGFSIPVRMVSNQQSSTGSNASSPDDPPSSGIPTSGLAQLSYAALQLQQQSSNPPNSIATKPTVSAATVVTTNSSPMARLITLDSSNSIPSSASRGIVPQRIRLSNSLSTSSGGRPIVVVSTSSSPGMPNTSATFSALDTAVLKARTARPPLDQHQQLHHHQVVVSTNMEAVSSSNTGATSATLPVSVTSVSPTQVSGHPRRVVIVSAQHHQECPQTQAASVTSPKPSLH